MAHQQTKLADKSMPPVLKFSVMMKAQDAIFAPQVFGGMIRGALGNALRSLNLTVYEVLYEPSDRDDLGARYKNPPVPFALECRPPSGGVIQAGENFSVGVSLYGEASVLADKVIEAVAIAAAHGFGKNRGRAEIIDTNCIWRSDSYAGQSPSSAPPVTPETPPMPTSASIALISPLRRKNSGAVMTHETFEAKPWIEAISSRMAILDAAYGDAGKVVAGATVPRIKTDERQLWWVEQFIWSSKQKGARDVSGVTGNFRLPLFGLEEHWPTIWAGQWYQVGSGVTAGLGAYRVIVE